MTDEPEQRLICQKIIRLENLAPVYYADRNFIIISNHSLKQIIDFRFR